MTSSTNSMQIVTTRTGTTELRRRWQASEPWATLLIVHGLAEHSGRYQQAGSRLAEAGIDTYAFDFVGFGASGGIRADIQDWSTYLHQVLDNLVPLFERNLPVVLLGHSIGGLIVVDYTLSRYRQPDLVVLNAPALDAVVPAWKRIGAPLLAGAVPRLTLANPINPVELFIDPEVAVHYRRDPLCITRTTVRLGDIILERMERVGRSLDLYDAPTLVLHGGADSLVPPQVSEPLGELPSVERRVYPRLRHASINEAAGKEIIEDIVAWIRSRIGPGS
ncbi:MAG: lysophospholipase [bacterium]|nr:lysophospholipase [bacterium]MDE0290819.1 lysophospholipase [bacterium]MDE0438233.1 lysophospholipase [bacterium]